MTAGDSPGFPALDIPRVIDTSNTDFINDFYIPLLSRSVEYKRGVGYFTSNWAQSAARGLTQLAKNGGTAKWLTSPHLSEEDWEAIVEGEQAKQDERLRQALERSIEDLHNDLEEDTREAIAWMIADGLLEIRLAIPQNSLSGDFHDKFGVFYDQDRNRVAFHGSKNDSEQALRNYEAYTIDCDWLSKRDQEGVDYHEKRFDALWENQDDNVAVYTIPESIKEELADLREYDSPPYDFDEEEESGITLRDYQDKAVKSWFQNACNGLFEMATGTGKTITALSALEQYLEEQDEPVITVIAVPVTHLAPQWAESMELFDFDNPRMIFGSMNPDWKSDLSKLVSNVNLGVRDQAFVITTHKTLSNSYFREKLDSATCKTLLIGDEVHRLGSDDQRKGLLASYDARIGLSATPERHYDEEGTTYLLEYFNGVIFKYTLADAIPDYLTPYDYHPIIVEMTQEELEEYQQLTKKVAAASASEDAPDEVVERLAMKRSKLVKSAENKYQALHDILDEIGDVDHFLAYTNPQQIDQVQEVLNEHGIIQHKFTYEEDDEERQRLLELFDKGDYDALVAMRCLDEGVDVPSTRQAVLMSNSGNPMQFVQRRGRLLRQYPGKDKAVIYDMIVVPSLHPPDDVQESEKNLLRKELDRFEEFADNARNEHQARNGIERLRTVYEI
ncbi:DEAD/DEAH box helicase family protein [Halopiger aswanensis]|uniref:Superfamily II DNA or RNA helicase n=1 Tax=Halopiger aswanensis TaxID=148449 RepID=A0A3R7HY77_9EURY|nr:DEAD/DEAH box helicase family protein [Halopiger aswanensis]RKD95613.1 superfamily II DNA or RNA helicase [Halopiger aswanensis]